MSVEGMISYVRNMERVVKPFVHPRATTRKQLGSGGSGPETDVLTLEVRMEDWWRLCAAAGAMDAHVLRTLVGLSPDLVPSEDLLRELDELFATHEEATR